MKPQVADVLLTDPPIKRVKFDLYEVLSYIGVKFPDGDIIFTRSDTIKILERIHNVLQAEGAPNYVFDLHIIGIPPAITAAQLASNLRLWDNVRSLSFSEPRHFERMIFETKVFPDESFGWESTQAENLRDLCLEEIGTAEKEELHAEQVIGTRGKLARRL